MSTSIPMLLWCPNGHRHIDEGQFATKPHHTHACQTCGIVWRPAKVDTVGVQFLPGYKNEPKREHVCGLQGFGEPGDYCAACEYRP